MTDQILAVQKMQDYIEAHLTEEITLATLADLCWTPLTKRQKQDIKAKLMSLYLS